MATANTELVIKVWVPQRLSFKGLVSTLSYLFKSKNKPVMRYTTFVIISADFLCSLTEVISGLGVRVDLVTHLYESLLG